MRAFNFPVTDRFSSSDFHPHNFFAPKIFPGQHSVDHHHLNCCQPLRSHYCENQQIVLELQLHFCLSMCWFVCCLPTVTEAIHRKYSFYFLELAESPKPPSPQFGQLGPLFLDVKNNVLTPLNSTQSFSPPDQTRKNNTRNIIPPPTNQPIDVLV